MIISEDLILLGLEASDRQAVLTTLAGKLLEKGIVREGFLASLLQREDSYPTGLPTVIPVALCHTEARFVHQSALALAVLRHPVAFREMGSPEHEVMVEMVFLLAIDDSKAQVATLQSLSLLLRDRAALESLRDATDPAQCAAYLRSVL